MSRSLVTKLVALVGVGSLALLQFSARGHRPDFSDFKVYWLAGAKALAHHTVYDVEGHYQYKYSPFVALLWAVPHMLGGSRYLWALAHYAACGVGFVALWLLCARLIDRERSVWLWLLSAFTFSIGLRDELKLGQANLWPILLVVPAWCSAPALNPPRRLDWRGLLIGAAWGLSIQWKLYALVLAPAWLLRRRWTVFAGAAVFSVASLGGALALAHGAEFALQENARWLQSLTASSQELLISQYNVSALGILGKWAAHAGIGLGAWAYGLWLLLAVGWGLVLLWAELAARSQGSSRLLFWSTSWAWAGIVVLNPLVWPYWLNFCLPLYLVYVDERMRAQPRRLDPAFLCVSALFLLANWLQNTSFVHEGASFVAVCALLFDAQRRLRGRTPDPVVIRDELGPAISTPPVG